MSSQSNVVAALKGLLHGTGANVADAKGAVDNTLLHYVTIFTGDVDATNANFANGTVSFMAHADMKLEGARLHNRILRTNVAGDDIIVTVACNGATVCTYNTNASADGTANVAAGSTTNLSINTANSFVNAGTYCNVAWTSADLTNNTFRQTQVTLILRPI